MGPRQQTGAPGGRWGSTTKDKDEGKRDRDGDSSMPRNMQNCEKACGLWIPNPNEQCLRVSPPVLSSGNLTLRRLS